MSETQPNPSQEADETVVTPAPVYVPELSDVCIGGESGHLDVNFCANHNCRNFGVAASSEQAQGLYKFTKPRDAWSWHLECLNCGQSQRLLNNVAVDKAFLYDLKRHLPHEYCTKTGCDNHRVNLYEYFGKRYGLHSRNEKKSIYQVRCRGRRQGNICNTLFPAGVPLGLHTDRERTSKYLNDTGLIIRLIGNDNGPGSMRDILKCGSGNYYSQLKNLAAAAVDISGYYFMQLLRRENGFSRATMCLYTDIIEIPFHVGGDEIRAETLKYIVTVTNYRDSQCILAATPMFYPDDEDKHTLRNELLLNSQSELDKPEAYRDNAHLYGPGVPLNRSRSGDKTKPGKIIYPPMGIDGYLMVETYALVSHFLLLRKLLDRVHTVVHYFDGERTLRNPAIIAFSDRIRDGRCEIMVSSYLKKTKGKIAIDSQSARNSLQTQYRGVEGVTIEKDESLRRTHLLGETLPAIREELEKSILEHRQKFDERDAEKETDRYEDMDCAMFRMALDGLWVSDPIPPSFEPGRRYLWLTRRPDSSPEHELALCMKATLQPIDMCFSAIRHTTSTAKRAANLPSQGNKRGYGSHAWLPLNVIHEFTLRQFYWNFLVRYDSDKKVARTNLLGIYDQEALDVDAVFPTFRASVIERARSITEWVGT